jgi:hypothetical protein
VKSYFALTSEEIAGLYVTSKGGPRQLPRTARSLYDDIQTYLREHGMDHRLDEAAEIAQHAYEVAKQVLDQEVPVQAEAAAAFRANVEGGTTASDSALNQMSLLGTEVARSTASHLFRL